MSEITFYHLQFHFTDRSKLNHPENNPILPIISNELQYKIHSFTQQLLLETLSNSGYNIPKTQ